MDNLAHALTGALIARTLPAGWNGEPASDPALDPDAETTRPGRWVMWASVVAANLPDFEALVLWPPPLGDKAAYLLHHRGWSHSLVGIAAGAVVFAGLLRLLARWRRAARFFTGFTFARGLAVAALGAGSHLFLDWWNGYGVRPFYPWDKSWYYGDLVLVVDPWVWLTLGGAVVCGTRRFGRAKWLWYVLTFAATAAVAEACRREVVPWWVSLGWLTGVAEIAALRWWGRWRGARWIGWGMVGCYLTAMAWVTGAAPDLPVRSVTTGFMSYRDEPVAALPVPGVPWERAVVTRRTTRSSYQWGLVSGTDERIGWHIEPVSVLSPAVPAFTPVPKLGVWNMAIADNLAADLGPTDPDAAAAWRSFARFPVFRFSERGEPRGVTLGDARYLLRGNDWTAITVPTEGIENRTEWGVNADWAF